MNDFALFHHFYPGLEPGKCTIARFQALVSRIPYICRIIRGDKDQSLDIMAKNTEMEVVLEDLVMRIETPEK